MRAAAVTLLLGVLLVAGCDGVPQLQFAAPDAATDGSVASDALSVENIDAGCPGSEPADAGICCGSVPCSGDCAGRCPECESTCTSPGTFCCAKMNNILCRQAGMTCN
jgi:hypothetical protein